MVKVYLSLGSNQGWKKHLLKKALRLAGKLGRISRISRFYLSKPYGKTDQPDFLNCAAELETQLSPGELLQSLQGIEARLGRVRAEKWGPRKIDLDIIFYGNAVIDQNDLKIPHPDMQNRDFVLMPLMDLCPDYIHPLLKKSVKELFQALKTGVDGISRS